MFQEIYSAVYHAEIWAAAAGVTGLVLVWSVLGAFAVKKMRAICAVAAVVFAGLILYITVFSRGSTAISHELKPFSTFVLGPKNPELYRAAIMNIFLFVPLGMTLPYLFTAAAPRRILLSVLIGGCLSAGIELAQHFLQVGMTQTDDVICNSLGTAFGACAYPLSLLWIRLRDKRKNKNKA